MNDLVQKLVSCSRTFVKRNSATILTCVGAIGVVVTAVTAVKATPRVIRKIQRAEDAKGDALTKLETVQVAAPEYMPAVMLGLSTILCIFGANYINKKTQAALTGAYILLDKTYKDYRSTVDDIFGEGADRRVLHAVLKKNQTEEGLTNLEESTLFYEEHYGKFFERPMRVVVAAEDALNDLIAKQGYACLNDLFYLLDLEPVSIGNYLGWSGNYVDFVHELVDLEGGLECCMINISNPTIPIE